MMRKTFFISIFAILSVLTIQAQTGSQNIRLNKGQKLESQASNTMTMSQDMMGQKIEVNSKSTVTMLTEVKDITNQSFLLTNTIKRMVMNTSVMGQEMNFDSDKKEDMEGQMGADLKDKIGVAQEITVDKQGKIAEIKDSAVNIKGQGGGMMSAMGDAMQGVMAKGMPYPLLVSLPSKSPKTGDTWTDSSGTPETIKLVNNYVIKQISGSEATIEISGQMAKTGVVEQQGMQIPLNMTGAIKGTSIIDINTGILKKNDTAMKITGTMELMGQALPFNMDNTTQTTVNKQQ